jgi:hypothetical protein
MLKKTKWGKKLKVADLNTYLSYCWYVEKIHNYVIKKLIVMSSNAPILARASEKQTS